MFCTECGQQATGAFCTSCGAAIGAGTTTAESTPVAPSAPPTDAQTPVAPRPQVAPLPPVAQPVQMAPGMAVPAGQPVAALPTTPTSNVKKILLWTLIPGGAVILAIILIVILAVPRSPFPAALKQCGLTSNDTGISLADGDKTLIIDGEGDYDTGLPIDDVVCLIEALDMSASVRDRFDHTSSLDGQVEGSWNNIDASWTYHPDDGVDMVLVAN